MINRGLSVIVFMFLVLFISVFGAVFLTYHTDFGINSVSVDEVGK
jgi:hypothetical protein